MKQIALVALISTLLFSCAKQQPQVSWLKIDKWDLVANPDAQNDQGELSHNLSEVFITMDGKFLGAFELPAKIPIIAEGTHDFILIPGIINNLESHKKKRYPFVEQYKKPITLFLNDTVSIAPTTRYYSSLNFLIEDFESPSMQIDVAEQSTATIGRNDDPEILKWGDKYGQVILNNQDSIIAFMTSFETVLPKLGSEVYLEFDYMNTNSMLISTISYGNGNYYEDDFVVVRPQKEGKAVWKHAYLDLKENVSYRQTTPINEVQFKLLLDDKEASKYLYIDNIKLIYP